MARQVARICEQPYQVIPVGEEFLSRFSHYAERAVYLTDGCVDVSRAPDLYLERKGTRNCPSQDDGELWRARSFAEFVPSSRRSPCRDCSLPEFLRYVRQASETYAESAPAGTRFPLPFSSRARGTTTGCLALEQTQLSVRSPFLDNDLVRTVFRAPESAVTTSDVSLRLIADGNRALLRIPTDRGLGRRQRTSLMRRPPKVSSSSLFKAEYAYDMGMPQWMARLDHLLRPFDSNGSFSGGTRSSISEAGTGMSSLGTFEKCCSTRAALPGPISNAKDSRP